MNSNYKKKIILIIDPDPESKVLLESKFTENEFEIIRFSSGRKALDAILRIKPFIIISELITEDLSGKMIFNKIVTEPKFYNNKHTPFIFLTKHELNDPQQEQQLFDLGLRGLFKKPFGMNELHQVLNNLFIIHKTFHRTSELRQEVKRSEYRYRDLLENANDLIFTLDQNGQFVYLNNRFTPLTGWEKEEWIGNSFLDLIDTTDRKLALEYYMMAHQGRARIFEARVVGRKSNTSTVLSFNITPIFEHGSIVGSIGIARDVTEQKKMEKEILDLKNFNESIIQSMEAGLLTTNLAGYITSLNAGAERILGWKSNDVVEKKLNSVLKPKQADILLSNPPPPGSLPYSRETYLTTKSGKKIAIGFTATDRVDNQNKKVGTIVSFRDISQLKQMQSEVIKMDRLASLGVLASGIAHEIKNPLAGIKTMAQACEEEFVEDDPRKEYLTRIVRQVNRLDDLLKTFFAYARPKPPDRRCYKLSEILREVTSLVEKKLKTAGIIYKEELNPDLPDVMVDSQQIQQVFLNLILNSVDSMSGGGKLIISSRLLLSPKSGLIGESPKNSYTGIRKYIEIRISDTGKGIAIDKLHTIFDPFFTTKSNGLGLGLSIVYRIIEEHQGDIMVDSQLEKGTTFTITLPTGVD
jgi:PAS domain S-box-containing protein